MIGCYRQMYTRKVSVVFIMIWENAGWNNLQSFVLVKRNTLSESGVYKVSICLSLSVGVEQSQRFESAHFSGQMGSLHFPSRSLPFYVFCLLSRKFSVQHVYVRLDCIIFNIGTCQANGPCLVRWHQVWVSWILLTLRKAYIYSVRAVQERLLYNFVYNVFVLCFMHYDKSIKIHNK